MEELEGVTNAKLALEKEIAMSFKQIEGLTKELERLRTTTNEMISNLQS